MALFPWHVAFFLTVLVTSCSPQTQARESNSFTKTVRHNIKDLSPPTAAAAEDGDPFSYATEGGNGYGLYGHTYDRLPSPDAENSDADKGFNAGYNNNNNYGWQEYGMSDTRFLENGKYYYDVSHEKKNPVKYGSSFGEYQTQGGGETSSSYDGYGNGKRKNEYDYNSYMEGYGKNKPEGEEGYVP